MTDFAKQKVAFAIGLLAALFTLTPLLTDYGLLGFDLFGVRFSLQGLYVFLSGILGLAVYCYGIQFITARRLRYAATAGDIFYALAIVAPGLFASLFVIATLTHVLAPLLRSSTAQIVVQNLLSAVAGAVSVSIAYRAQRTLAQTQRNSEAALREDAEVVTIRRAEELLRAGHNDLAVIEAFKALEMAARNISWIARGGPANNWFRKLKDILPQEFQLRLDSAREIRNEAAHSARPVSESEAQEVLATANKLLAVLSDLPGSDAA